MNRKITIAAVVAVIVATGAFFGGLAASDPTASGEYKTLAKDLKDIEKNLAATEEELASTVSELGEAESDLTEAETRLDALMSEAQDAGVVTGEPAVSGGAAVAPRNFQLGIRTRSKNCFGSAGCNVVVQIDPSYVGNQDLSTGSWELIYELRGGEDGPIIETMTLESGTFSFPEEQMVSTRSTSTKITAVVTEVYSLG